MKNLFSKEKSKRDLEPIKLKEKNFNKIKSNHQEFINEEEEKFKKFIDQQLNDQNFNNHLLDKDNLNNNNVFNNKEKNLQLIPYNSNKPKTSSKKNIFKNDIYSDLKNKNYHFIEKLNYKQNNFNNFLNKGDFLNFIGEEYKNNIKDDLFINSIEVKHKSKMFDTNINKFLLDRINNKNEHSSRENEYNLENKKNNFGVNYMKVKFDLKRKNKNFNRTKSDFKFKIPLILNFNREESLLKIIKKNSDFIKTNTLKKEKKKDFMNKSNILENKNHNESNHINNIDDCKVNKIDDTVEIYANKILNKYNYQSKSLSDIFKIPSNNTDNLNSTTSQFMNANNRNKITTRSTIRSNRNDLINSPDKASNLNNTIKTRNSNFNSNLSVTIKDGQVSYNNLDEDNQNKDINVLNNMIKYQIKNNIDNENQIIKNNKLKNKNSFNKYDSIKKNSNKEIIIKKVDLKHLEIIKNLAFKEDQKKLTFPTDNSI